MPEGRKNSGWGEDEDPEVEHRKQAVVDVPDVEAELLVQERRLRPLTCAHRDPDPRAAGPARE